MKIKALSSIIEFDNGQMVVINEGETEDSAKISDTLLTRLIASKAVEYVKDDAAGAAPEASEEPAPKKGKVTKAVTAEPAPADNAADEAPAE